MTMATTTAFSLTALTAPASTDLDALQPLLQTIARIFEAPMVLLRLQDESGRTATASFGLPAFAAGACCRVAAQVAAERTVMVVPDLGQLSDLAGEPQGELRQAVRFCAAAPLLDETGQCLGSLCVLDTCSRGLFSSAQRQLLLQLAGMSVRLLRLKSEGRGRAGALRPTRVSAVAH